MESLDLARRLPGSAPKLVVLVHLHSHGGAGLSCGLSVTGDWTKATFAKDVKRFLPVISPESLQCVLEHQGTQACCLSSRQSPVHSKVKTAFLENEIKFFMGLHINWETGAKPLSNINMKLDSAKFPFTRRMCFPRLELPGLTHTLILCLGPRSTPAHAWKHWTGRGKAWDNLCKSAFLASFWSSQGTHRYILIHCALWM